MTSHQITILPDDAMPAAGTATIRFAGLKSWPEGATIRLLPLDDAAVPANATGWPWDPIRPHSVEVTDAGIDVVLGPEVAASPRLLPGTPVAIHVAAAAIESEARWPSITPPARRRAGAVAMSANQLLAAKSEREEAERLATTRRNELAEQAVRAAEKAEAAVNPARAADTASLARLLSHRRADTAEGTPRSETIAAAQPLGQLARLGSAPPANIVAMPPPPAPRASRRAWGVRGFLAGLTSMAAVGALIATLASQPWSAANFGGARLPAPAANQIAAADLARLFKDFAASGTQSPHNKSSANVDTATALSLADHSLRGQRTAADAEEAEFWLKKALAGSMGGQEIGWALTQLGTIYATAGTASHSYAKAHAIWQLAAAQGDPVAHCFLGALYENGLGVAKDKKAAREHYLAADALGVCRSAKEAAARLSE